jgi:hypothetical protein
VLSTNTEFQDVKIASEANANEGCSHLDTTTFSCDGPRERTVSSAARRPTGSSRLGLKYIEINDLHGFSLMAKIEIAIPRKLRTAIEVGQGMCGDARLEIPRVSA